jgi:glycerol-3-phosphate dehydrogenase
METRVPCVVIGAGAVGLSIAKALSEAGRYTLILEKNGRFGEENSSRNSEVLHSGIYYPKNCLKTVRTNPIHYTLIHSYTHTLIHSYTHTLIHSYTHTLINSYTYSALLWEPTITNWSIT